MFAQHFLQPFKAAFCLCALFFCGSVERKQPTLQRVNADRKKNSFLKVFVNFLAKPIFNDCDKVFYCSFLVIFIEWSYAKVHLNLKSGVWLPSTLSKKPRINGEVENLLIRGDAPR